MISLRFLVLLIMVSFFETDGPLGIIPVPDRDGTVLPGSPEHGNTGIKGALLSTRFKSFEALKSVIQIEYFNTSPGSQRRPMVRIRHSDKGGEVTSVLTAGISQHDFQDARDGGFWDRVGLGLRSPYAAINKSDLLRVFILARRRSNLFGEGDPAFYDLAENTLNHIHDDDVEQMPSEDLSEKGYLNTFNHITAQAFMTTLFSESLADFIADIHERYNMPELITGDFTDEEIADLENGPVDNYVDIVNNEWGQELGKRLREKHQITRETVWTPELLENYLNDIQDYYSWALQIGFTPFRAEDEVVTRFSKKINRVMEDVSGLR